MELPLFALSPFPMGPTRSSLTYNGISFSFLSAQEVDAFTSRSRVLRYSIYLKRDTRLSSATPWPPRIRAYTKNCRISMLHEDV
jgi:hypothetical protein